MELEAKVWKSSEVIGSWTNGIEFKVTLVRSS
jgi:hypothetical protein